MHVIKIQNISYFLVVSLEDTVVPFDTITICTENRGTSGVVGNYGNKPITSRQKFG